MRGLCNGLGPAMFGVIFYLFNVDLNDDPNGSESAPRNTSSIPGPPFVFGAFMVVGAILVALLIPDERKEPKSSRSPSEKKSKFKNLVYILHHINGVYLGYIVFVQKLVTVGRRRDKHGP